ncbi:MAG: hypothetical protein ACOVSR_00485 [Bacteroidia bacterium]
MNKAEFTDLIKNPEKLGSEHIETLKKIVTDYPYFSTAHILLAKALLNTNHYEYEKQLKHTALIVGDRSVLHQFLHDNNLDLGNDQDLFNIPIELKVEKVSKPDFEIGKEEQDALLNEAQQILGIKEDYSNEIIPEELVNEKIESNHDHILETNSPLTENIKPELFNEVLNDNLYEISGEENHSTSTENIAENVIESKDEQIENILQNTEIEHNQKTITELNNESGKDSDFHLTETEGTLVRFTLEDNFLPDFDEASLFIEEQNIETITKSVLPQISSTSEKYDELLEEETSIDSLTDEFEFKPTEVKIESVDEQLSTFDKIESQANNFEKELINDLLEDSDNNEIILTENDNSIQNELNIENKEVQYSTFDSLIGNNHEEDIINKSIEAENSNELLVNNDANQNELNIGNTEEKRSTIDNLMDDNPELEKLEELVEVENNIEILENNDDSIQNELNIGSMEELLPTLDNININNDKTESQITNVLIEEVNSNEGLTELESISESESESHNFIDWLTKNKSDATNSLIELPINKTPVIINHEDVEFNEKIIQILKTKAEFDLSKNINYELTLANELSRGNDKKAETTDIITTDKEEIVEPVEISTPSVVNSAMAANDEEKIKIPSNEDEVYEEIESFSTQFVSLENKEVNENRNDINLSSLSETFIPEIYTGEVPSILPDFEALNKIDEIEEELTKPETFIKYDKKEGLIPDYNIPVFEPKLTLEKEVENEEDLEEVSEEVFPSFNTAPINEVDFEAVFSNAFEPLPPKIEVKELVENKIQETENTNNVKQDVESILDKFMRENPSITRPKSEFFNPANVAKLSVEEKDEIVSETLASIYLKQGLIKKAILTYEKLSLIYPHKITYFAALINQIKTEHNIN